MPLFNTEGIVLKQFDLGEADKIITFITRDMGKLRAVAKGVRKTRSSISGLVLPFSYAEVTIYRGRSLDKINRIKVKYSFSPLREDLTRMAYASYMAEFIEKVSVEDDNNRALFSLLLSSFHRLLKAEEISEYNHIILAFKIRILVILGIKPELSSCVDCGQQNNPGSINIFSIERGGLLCHNCSSNHMDGMGGVQKISGESLRIMANIIDSGLKPLDKLKISTQAFEELDGLLDSFITYHLDLRFKSLDFLHMIRDLG
ncbi:DNA repair protein RecO [Halothermothrix orenii]|uniref:DNA repair protein RecO n=1 Tax=Halothermothrix orenii (strain H 168 / OCM 544 / DSM 9562) TaxID=373903 RepID=B8CXH9_HALOH|nr:DNA repair protein RecO [Halothermothrix orenii]ACL69998.1 DNA repair protein RecO [Halothermothrix orenii H 168]